MVRSSHRVWWSKLQHAVPFDQQRQSLAQLLWQHACQVHESEFVGLFHNQLPLYLQGSSDSSWSSRTRCWISGTKLWIVQLMVTLVWSSPLTAVRSALNGAFHLDMCEAYALCPVHSFNRFQDLGSTFPKIRTEFYAHSFHSSLHREIAPNHRLVHFEKSAKRLTNLNQRQKYLKPGLIKRILFEDYMNDRSN